MASYVSKVLLPQEETIYVAELHWIIYMQGLFFTAAAGLLSFSSRPLLYMLFGERVGDQMAQPLNIIALLLLLIGIFLIIGAYLRQTTTEIVITNKRLIAKYGVISRATFEILANRITGANFEQSIMGRFLGYGTILVHGAGGEISPIDVVDNPQLFYRALVSVLEKTNARFSA